MIFLYIFRFGSWQATLSPQHCQQQNLQQQQQQQQNLSQCDDELQHIFMNGHQTPPGHRILNENNRCQSVPVPQNGNRVKVFQPLTPQQANANVYINNNNINENMNQPSSAKRNLNLMFDKPTRQQFVSPVGQKNNMLLTRNQQNLSIIDRIVPNSAISQMQTLNKPKEAPSNDFYDLLNDLSTPEEMGDIPSGIEKLDGDDLINSLENTSNNWSNDWSTSTVPLMNINQ